MIFKLMVSFIFPLNNSGMKGTLNNISPSFTIFCPKKRQSSVGLLGARLFFGSEEMYFGIPEGECFGYLGLNGAGKTTTMQLGVRSMLFGWVKTQRLIV